MHMRRNFTLTIPPNLLEEGHNRLCYASFINFLNLEFRSKNNVYVKEKCGGLVNWFGFWNISS